MAKSKWQRFQILIAGPAMNIAARRGAAGGGADAGRRRARVSRSSRGGRRGAARIRRRRRPASSPATRITHIRHGRRPHLGTPRHGGGVAARARSRSRRCCATAAKSASRSVPTSPSCARATTRASKSAPSACCRTSIRSVASFIPGKPAEAAGPQGRRRDPRDRRRAHGVRVASARGDLEEAGRQADRVPRPPRRRRADDCRDAVQATATGRMVGIYPRERDASSYKPTPIEAIGMSVQRNVEMAGLILAHAEGSRHRRSVAETVDGAGRHRAAVGRVGAGRAGSRCSA